MKHIGKITCALLLAGMMASCSTEQRVISQLEHLNKEVQTNGADYSLEEWKDFADRYKKVVAKSKDCHFNNAELEKVTELNGRIVKNAGLKAKANVWGRIKSILFGILKAIAD